MEGIMKEPTFYEDADFIQKCSCGHVDVKDRNVSGELRMSLYTTDAHNLQLTCPECGHTIELCFRPAETPKVEDAVTTDDLVEKDKENENESVPEESKTEE